MFNQLLDQAKADLVNPKVLSTLFIAQGNQPFNIQRDRTTEFASMKRVTEPPQNDIRQKRSKLDDTLKDVPDDQVLAACRHLIENDSKYAQQTRDAVNKLFPKK